ncbi:MAG: Ribosomal protein [Steroidobacteraceae bacterium]|nr:Ribosomal protein [Steroidobacteraceae bacterium]
MSAAKKEAAPKAEKSAAKAPKTPKAKKVVDIKDAPKVASQEKLINLLTTPHITEKTSLAMQNANTYSFRVLRNSSKPEIKAAVELTRKPTFAWPPARRSTTKPRSRPEGS